MSYKKFMLFRLVIIVIIAALGAWAATSGNLVLLIPAVLVLAAVMFALRRKVTEVVVDERVNTIPAVIAGAALTNLAEGASDVRFSIGLTLDYSACALMVFYWLGYIYYNRKLGGKE
jgi:uncharacterized membrane protein